MIFDCDGVLVDSVPLINSAMSRAFAAFGLQISPDEVQRHFRGLLNAEITELVASRWGVKLPENFTEVIAEAEWAAMIQGLQPTPGAASAVRAVVESGTATCVASNGTFEEIEHRLTLTGLITWFEGRMFSAMAVPRPKPHPDVFLHAADTMGYPPSECVVVEDSPAGIQAGVSAGMRVLAYTGGADDGTVSVPGVESFTSLSSLPELLGL